MSVWVRWLPSALWGALILLLSTRPETFFFAAAQSTHYRVIHYYLEITVHLVEFCVFFLLVAWSLRFQVRPWGAVIGRAFGAVLILSLLNESIQAYTPTRMFDVGDMTVDALGGAVGVLLCRSQTANKDIEIKN
ncbi:VanZ family protein [Candidatus Methylomirabilis sp.]|jgi:VanZ family protein|uniref:VanZ family protein n=1 Tax=Candidatus Methylomirabilis sp. TaxID=2032687 RepID=UPI003C75278B